MSGNVRKCLDGDMHCTSTRYSMYLKPKYNILRFAQNMHKTTDIGHDYAEYQQNC